MTHSKILIALLVVAILGILGYVAVQPGKTDVVVNESPEQPSGKKMAFSQFLKQGGTYACEVHQYVNDADTVGTAYIHDGMIRGEYSTSIQDRNIDATVIVRDGFAYTWTSMAPTAGFKSAVVENPETGATGTSGTYSYSTDQIGDYDCQPWTPDLSKFSIPADVTFREV